MRIELRLTTHQVDANTTGYNYHQCNSVRFYSRHMHQLLSEHIICAGLRPRRGDNPQVRCIVSHLKKKIIEKYIYIYYIYIYIKQIPVVITAIYISVKILREKYITFLCSFNQNLLHYFI